MIEYLPTVTIRTMEKQFLDFYYRKVYSPMWLGYQKNIPST